MLAGTREQNQARLVVSVLASNSHSSAKAVKNKVFKKEWGILLINCDGCVYFYAKKRQES